MVETRAEKDRTPRVEDRPAIPSKCVKCAAPLLSPIVCAQCHSLFLAPPTADYFELLGLPWRFDLDKKHLHSVVLELARRIHPDRFGGASAELQTLATRLSAQINEAHRVLGDPVRRADYMLTRSGGPSPTECREVPGDLLSEIMTLREELEQAKGAGNESAMERHRRIIDERRTATLSRIVAMAGRLSQCSDGERKDLRRLLNSMKYFDSLQTELAADPLARQPT